MKSLIYISLLFSIVSCGTKLPDNFYQKQLHEENYVENTDKDYSLHVNHKVSGYQIFNRSANNSLQLDTLFVGEDSIITLENQQHRPYFSFLSGKDTVILANRHIDFDHVENFRDIGGLKTNEGKVVKWGMIFRSDNLSKLKKSEFDKFNDLDIKTVFDLRTENEIKGVEDNLPADIAYFHLATVKDKGDLITQMRAEVLKGKISEERSRELMLELYRDAVSENVPAIRDLVNQVLDAEKPVLYHCSAGKDRTGITTAIILSILKVDRETIMDEFLMSNYYRRNKIKRNLKKAELAKIIKPHLNLKVVQTFMSVDAAYLKASFDVIDKKYGGMDAFIKNQLRISDQKREQAIKKFTY